MIGLIITLVICGSILYLWRELKPLVTRAIRVSESNALDHTAATTPIVEADPMPEYVKEMILSESEQWARADMVQLLRDAYAKTKDWNKAAQLVRQASDDAPVYTNVLFS